MQYFCKFFRGKIMKKQETPEQLAARKQKEAREIVKWERIKAQKLPKHYFFMLMIVVTVVYIVDEISSNMNGTFLPYIYFDFFNITSRSTADPLYSDAINKMTIFGIIPMLFGIIQPFYKSLSDTYGRRLFLMINTCMMGVGLFVCLIAPTSSFISSADLSFLSQRLTTCKSFT